MQKRKIMPLVLSVMGLLALGSCGTKTDVTSSEQTSSSESVHEHSWNTEWSKDETGHWKTCSGCNEISDKAAHTWDDGTVAKEATCTVDGEKKYSCTVCGYEKTETIPATGHAWSDAYYSDEDYHWHACTHEGCAAESEQESHTWDEGVVTTPATCTVDGEKTYTCAECGRTKTETIPATGHAWSDAYYSDEDYHWHACTHEGCAAESEQESHTWDEGVVTTPATCTVDGEKTYTCAECGRTKTEDIPMTGHSSDGKYTVETIDEEGTLVAMHCPEDDAQVNAKHLATPAGAYDLTPAELLAGSEGLFTFTNDTTYPWAVDETTQSIASGNKGKGNSKSRFTITALADITISFTTNVNSESNYDYVSNSFGTSGTHEYISGANTSNNSYYSSKVSGMNGETITVDHQIYMTAGAEVSFTYQKDSSGDKGEDKAWITNFRVSSETIKVTADALKAVTFNTRGGNEIDPAIVFAGKTVASPSVDPIKEGYVFDGWYSDAECMTAFDFETAAITDNTVIYAKWIDAKTVTIVYNNGQENGTQIVGEGKTFDPGKPTYESHKFCGWYTDESCAEGYEFTSETPVNADMTIYAKWEDAPAYAGYTYYGCEYYGLKSSASANPLSIDYENKITGPMTGYISSFDETTGTICWGTSDGGTSYGPILYKEGIIVSTYYHTKNETVVQNADIYIMSRYNTPTFKGKSYAFPVTGGVDYTNRLFQTMNAEGDTQLNFLYAGVIYTNVTISSLSGTPDTASLELNTLKDVTITASDNTVIASYGYKTSSKAFVEADAHLGNYTGEKGNLYVNGADIAIIGDTTYTYVSLGENSIRLTSGNTVYDVTFDGTTYTAVVPTSTVTFNTCEGDPIESSTVTTSLAIGDLPTPTREGYIFKGWYTEAAYENAVTSKYVVTDDVTLYAKWAQLAVLSFDSKDGTAVEAMTVETGQAIKAPTEPTRDGYRFDGWYEDEDCKTAFVFANGISGSKTVYAKWVATTTVTLHNPTGPNTDATSVTIDAGTTYTAETPNIVGYTGFGGWYTDADFTTEYVPGTVTDGLDLYAKWTGKYANDAANYIDSILGDAVSYIGWGNKASYSGAYSWNYNSTDNTLTPNNKGVGNSYATFSITFAKAGTFSFNYAASSEPTYDGLVVSYRMSESDGWTQYLAKSTASGTSTGTVTLEVEAGETVVWYYNKDGSGDKNNDIVTLSNFTWTETTETSGSSGETETTTQA